MVFIGTWCLVLLAGLYATEVYGGTPAHIEDFPSIVQIENGVGPVWVQTCVGSVLTSRHVLSAAHCFHGRLFNPRFRRVRAGASERGRDGAIFLVESVNNHPSFGVNGLDGDITVIRLSSVLAFGSTIQQAAITAYGISFPANIPVTVAGWGRTAQDAIWADRNLHSVGLHTVDQDSCVAKYVSLPVPVTITDNMICMALAEVDGKNIGVRDSGAPVYYDGVLIGIAAFGSPVGDSYPLVATAISSYTNWIIEAAV